MDNLVVILDTARKLKAAGYPQGIPAFYYLDGVLYYNQSRLEFKGNDIPTAAPTAQELMDMLITNRHSSNMLFRPFDEENKSWLLEAEGRRSTYYVEDGSNIAELLAGAWLKLEETK